MLWRIYRTWDIGAHPVPTLAWRAAGLSIVAAVLDNAIAVPLLDAFSVANILPTPNSNWAGSFLLRCLLYLAWSALYFGLRETIYAREKELRLAHMEAATREAELSLLRAQVNTHFLFNALNAILAEVDDHPENAKTLTQALTRYLHFSLRQDAERVPLGEELDAMASYLAVQKIRFGDDFEFSIHAPEEARAALAPPASLQPLVENAVQHGMETSPAPLVIGIDAAVRDSYLHLQVTNSGHWADTGRESRGIGLSNLRRRLALIYQGHASLEHSPSHGTVRVAVRIPL